MPEKHGCGHGHSHGAVGKVRLAFFLIVAVLAVELIVGILSNSLALLADAGHVLTDLFALALSWFALRQAERPADALRTFGYHRTGIMVAFVNAATLILIACWIGVEAYHRLSLPEPVNGALMMIAALVGLLVNLYVGYELSHEQTNNLNVRSVLIHVMGDALASFGVIVGAAVIWYRPDWGVADPIIAMGIALLIAFGSWQIVHDAVSVLMEGTPKDIDMEELVRRIKEVPGVDGVHDLHVWSIATGMPSLTCHLLLHELEVMSSAAVMNGVRDLLRDQFGIEHCTIQPEWELCGPDNLYCSFDLLREMATEHQHSEELHEHPAK